MIALGKKQKLPVLRQTSVGFYLGDGEEDVLLPNKLADKTVTVGEELEVFVFPDSQHRKTATLQEPLVQINQFAFLEVFAVSQHGAFLDWNMDTHLFVPFQEQKEKMQEGEYYLVHVYIDEKSDRIVASAKWEKFIQHENITLKELDEVETLVLGETPLGYKCIVNHLYDGLIYKNETFKDIGTGDVLTAYIKQIREDGKLDVILEKPGIESLEKHAQQLLSILRKNGGFLPFHDKSDADEIREAFEISKKAFKRAIGSLYKQRLIELKDNGIQLIK